MNIVKTNDVASTAVQITNSSNVMHLLQITLIKLSEASDLPIKIICGEKDKYLIRQQLNEINCQSNVYMNEDVSVHEPSIIFTVTLP